MLICIFRSRSIYVWCIRFGSPVLRKFLVKSKHGHMQRWSINELRAALVYQILSQFLAMLCGCIVSPTRRWYLSALLYPTEPEQLWKGYSSIHQSRLEGHARPNCLKRKCKRWSCFDSLCCCCCYCCYFLSLFESPTRSVSVFDYTTSHSLPACHTSKPWFETVAILALQLTEPESHYQGGWWNLSSLIVLYILASDPQNKTFWWIQLHEERENLLRILKKTF